MILDLAASNPLYAQKLTFAAGRPGGGPGGAVLFRFGGRTAWPRRRFGSDVRRPPGRARRPKEPNCRGADDFWKIRKAGFSLLMAIVGDSKPVAFVEDTAVAPNRLPAFYERFFEIVGRQGLDAACYGHADVGCLHIRPIIT